MSGDKWAAILAAVASMSVLVAGFFQWWDVTWGGKLVTRGWVKVLFAVLLAVQVVVVGLVIATP